jgi:hypothetical protein
VADACVKRGTASDELMPRDAAWCTVPTLLPVEELQDFCRDTQRLLRINPLYEFDDWQVLPGNNYHFSGKNLSNGQAIDVDIRREERTDGFDLLYEKGLKQRTEFRYAATEQGSELLMTECYSEQLDAAQREARLAEVDHSLVPWAKDLQQYLLGWQRWKWCAPWRWYMDRVWQPMKPSARRISYMLIWVTVAEMIAFLMVFLIFWLEFDAYFL